MLGLILKPDKKRLIQKLEEVTWLLKRHNYNNVRFYLAKSKTPEGITEDYTTGWAYFAAWEPTDRHLGQKPMGWTVQ